MVLELVAGVAITVGFLVGIRLMQSPATALWGNRLGALAMLAAIALAIHEFGIDASGLVFVLAGGAAGVLLGQKVHMIQMPQMVALFNGLGGAASALVAATAMATETADAFWVFWLTAALALGIGVLTFSGSIIAALKLHNWISQKPVMLTGHTLVLSILLLAGTVLIALVVAFQEALYPVLILAVFALYGILMALRIGGADMPVIISFLNSLSGIAASVSGLAVGNPVLAGVGALVGVAGMILTQVMCRAMNRSLAAVLSGFQAAKPDAGAGTWMPARAETEGGTAKRNLTEDDLYPVLHEAERVIFVPGYGMALAKAQRTVKTLANAFVRDGKQVSFAIHPVAGRMPGHMNVLLAEAGIGFNKLHDMRVINPEFPQTDVVIIVGACDVVNPAASTARGTPIYGMPVLNAVQARAVVVCNLDEKPGYSGVENTLYRQSHVIPMWGDAAETLSRITAEYRSSRETTAATADSGETERRALQEMRSRIRSSEIATELSNASKVAIIPGYGMARGHAAEGVKALIDALTATGVRVTVGIHPYAGRILGHIPFLLSEAGVEDHLYGFPSDLNTAFPSFDLVIGVGANDILNPGLSEAAGDQPFVVPPFRAWEAKRLILFNLAEDTGWAEVTNPIFSMDHALMLPGDARDSVAALADECLNRVG